jgi:hypothetical protein
MMRLRKLRTYGVSQPRWWPEQWHWRLGCNDDISGKEIVIFLAGRRYEFRPAHWGPYRGHVYYGSLHPDVSRISDALARTGLPVSSARVLAAISRIEGGFDSIQTFDRAKFCWGLIQFSLTGGLPALLRDIRHCHPHLYQLYFAANGIELDANGNIQVHSRGRIWKDAGMRNRLHDDPNLWKPFLIASHDSAIQDTQVKCAYENYFLRVQSYTIRMRDAEIPLGRVFAEHDYGRAILFDRAIHAGVPGAVHLFRTAAKACTRNTCMDADTLLQTAAELDAINAGRWELLKESLNE